jgi:hypothetical protein
MFVQKVATGEARIRLMAKDQHKYMITNGVVVKVGTPLSFNLETNEMTVTTPAGTKVVAVLPDAALQKARAAGIDAPLDLQPIDISETDTTTTPTINPDDDTIQLVDYQNSPTYAIKGSSYKNLLWFIPLKIDKTVYVSAVSGNVVATKSTPLAKFLDLVSF